MSLPALMRAVTLRGFGGREMLQLSSDVPMPKLKNDTDLLVKIAATAVNRGDIAQRKGTYPPPPGASEIIGMEASGTVVSAGEKASRFKVGDRVMALLPGGGYAEYCAVPEGHCMPVPSHLSLVEAAAIPEVFLTAYQAIWFEGQKTMPPPKTVLIHTGASGVGNAATQMVVATGGKAITTSSEGKVAECASFGAIALSRTEENGFVFAEKLEKAVGTNSVDMVIDPVFGPQYLEENVRVLARDGRIVVLSFLNGPKIPDFNAAAMFPKRITLQFSTLRSRSDQYKADLIGAFTKDILPKFSSLKTAEAGEGSSSGSVYQCRPLISKQVALEDVAAAHEAIETNAIVGKCVMVVDGSLQ